MAGKTQLKQIVIIGGGSSIKEGIKKGLWDKLKNRFVIGLNYSYNFFDNTILCYVDDKFYEKESKKEKFQSFPLIIGKEHRELKLLSNTITLKANDAKYYRDVKLGCYKSGLVGLFALSLGIYLLDEGEIFLLGYDYGAIGKAKDRRALTHFYQGQINHRGIGKTNYFHTIGRADRDFGVFADEKKVKIYNVSFQSNITTFPKISYDEFFTRLRKESDTQDQLREYIKEKLK